MRSSIREELEEAEERFYINAGKITQLWILNIGARVTFGTDRGRKEYLKDSTNKEIEGYARAFPNLQKHIEKYGVREGYWRWARGLPLRVKRLVNQLSIVFLVTVIEAYLGEITMIAIKNKPECLGCDRTITWDNVIKLKKYDSIISQFANQKLNDIMAGDWRKIETAYKKTFKIALNRNIDSKKMLEVFELRHAIVHNAGIADNKFMNKVRKSGFELDYKINKEIILNQKSCDKIVSYCEQAMEYIKGEIEEYLGLGGRNEEGNSNQIC